MAARVDGADVINFCNNDYLGLANHPTIKHAAITAIQQDGFGGGSSHLVIGHQQQHHLLEQELAAFVGTEAALLFSTGYMANVGVLAALAQKADRIVMDKLAHASLIDGGQLSAAKLQRFKHLDQHHLAALLAEQKYARQFVVTDGIFSMDGDMANLPRQAELCKQHDAVLIVDDAHGFGVIGPQGRGSVAHFGLSCHDVPVQIGTLGKAFGSAGAFVAGSQHLIDYLVQFARPYIYTTAMPPSTAAATRAALKLIVQADEQRTHLDTLIRHFRHECKRMGYQLWPSFSPIQPIVLGESHKALACSEFLRQRGFLVSAIRPPTVPQGSARLRVTLCSTHSEQQLHHLLSSLYDYAQQHL